MVGMAMYRVVVIDDENTIRRGIVNLINWNELDCEVVAEFSNGLDTVNYLKNNQVDIVVSDIKMPGMNGIQLAEYICNNSIQAKMIILSAYSDFEYAKQAIKFKVFDFVIKNGFAKELPEVIKKAVSTIKKEREESSKLITVQRSVYENINDVKEKFILEYLLGYTEDINEIKRKFESLNILLDSFIVITCEIMAEDSEFLNNIHAEIKKSISLGFEGFYHISLVVDRELIATVVSLKENSNNTVNQIKNLCNNILFMINEFLKVNVRFGISLIHDRLDELAKAYQESKTTLAYIFDESKKISTFDEYNVGQKCVNEVCVNKYIERIVSSLEANNVTAAGNILEQLFNEYISKNITIEDIKVSALAICTSCFMLISTYKTEDNTHIEYGEIIYKKINKCKYINRLYEIVNECIQYVFDAMNNNVSNQKQIVNDINNYIMKNYSRKITLNDIASNLHISCSYLSRLYKKEQGETIINFLNKTRIEMAKKLLKNTALRISDVANEVGFDDPAYFTHVFIKYTGSSPKDFRENKKLYYSIR